MTPHLARTGTARLGRSLVLVVVAGLILAGCGDDDANASTETTGARAASSTAPLTGEITVSAAASLTDPFTELGAAFEEANRGTTVNLNFDSSGALATQIRSGAPADVVASADTTTMDDLVAEGLVDGRPTVFARNLLTIVVKPGNPAGISTLADLTNAGVISLCADTAPCGKYADRVLDRAGVTLRSDDITRGQNAKATLAAVASGDADAGIVYVTDARSGADVERIDIAAADNAEATYPIAVVAASQNSGLATAFVGYVSSSAGLEVLVDAGFLAP